MEPSSTTSVVNRTTRRRSDSSAGKFSSNAERVWIAAVGLIAVALLIGYLFSRRNAAPPATLPLPARSVAEKTLTRPAANAGRTAPGKANASGTAPVLSLEAIQRAIEGVRAIPDPVIEQPDEDVYPRAARSALEAQVELARRGFSSGALDGIAGNQTVAALQAFQSNNDLPVTGLLDATTLEHLVLATPAVGQRTVSEADLLRLQPLSATWLGKSQQDVLDYETAIELIGERYHAHPHLLRRLNPGLNWNAIAAGTEVTVPLIENPRSRIKAARVQIRLAEHVLEAFDADGRILAHFPVSIARNVEKRPVGELHVTVVIPNPNYTFNPEVFPESAEAAQLGRILILPPGPNNPVGLAWIGLDRPGYGMHGTPGPEQVGRTESHGCFRLANWDAIALIDLAWVGLPVMVDP